MAYRRTPQIQARLDAQREAILVAAVELLGERGYAACSMANVARRAGVASGTVYNHFEGKSGLTVELFRRVAERELDAVRRAADSGTDASMCITSVIETFAIRAMRSPRRAYALMAEPVDRTVDELRIEFRLSFRAVLADIVARGIDSGEFVEQSPPIVAAALAGAISEALVGPLSVGVDDPDVVAALLAFARRALSGSVRAYA